MNRPWRNVLSVHHRWMARFLRRRGWVVFYLDDPCRHCTAVCWLDCYLQSELRR